MSDDFRQIPVVRVHVDICLHFPTSTPRYPHAELHLVRVCLRWTLLAACYWRNELVPKCCFARKVYAATGACCNRMKAFSSCIG